VGQRRLPSDRPHPDTPNDFLPADLDLANLAPLIAALQLPLPRSTKRTQTGSVAAPFESDAAPETPKVSPAVWRGHLPINRHPVQNGGCSRVDDVGRGELVGGLDATDTVLQLQGVFPGYHRGALEAPDFLSDVTANVSASGAPTVLAEQPRRGVDQIGQLDCWYPEELTTSHQSTQYKP
jgi:hypothetical protein